MEDSIAFFLRGHYRAGFGSARGIGKAKGKSLEELQPHTIDPVEEMILEALLKVKMEVEGQLRR